MDGLDHIVKLQFVLLPVSMADIVYSLLHRAIVLMQLDGMGLIVRTLFVQQCTVKMEDIVLDQMYVIAKELVMVVLNVKLMSTNVNQLIHLHVILLPIVQIQ